MHAPPCSCFGVLFLCHLIPGCPPGHCLSAYHPVMMDLWTWTDWVGVIVFGVVTSAGFIAGLREARRFRDDPADRKRDTDSTD